MQFDRLAEISTLGLFRRCQDLPGIFERWRRVLPLARPAAK
jgi:hypothetical protein